VCLSFLDHIHDEILRKNSKFLKENMQMDGLPEKMMEKKLFSPKMVDEVKTKESQSDQVLTFLTVLRRRGSKSFDVFIECLKESSQIEVVDRLESSLEMNHVEQVHK
jgi:hypothetical protein